MRAGHDKRDGGPILAGQGPGAVLAGSSTFECHVFGVKGVEMSLFGWKSGGQCHGRTNKRRLLATEFADPSRAW